MRALPWMAIACGVLAATPSPAQGPGNDRNRPAGGEDSVGRMMAFDKDKDGTLTRAEVSDERLHRLFDRADANKDRTVTRKELADLVAAEPAGGPGGPGGFGFGGGPGGPGGPRAGMMGLGLPGEVLSEGARRDLKLDAEQAKRVDELQKEVDARLAEILADEQEAQLRQMKERGPGGRGGPGGGRFGGPGGPPPPPPGRRP